RQIDPSYPFSLHDALPIFATAAGVAIENARLYEETRRRERWLEASAEISTALLSGAGTHEVTALVAARAREIAGAALGNVALIRSEEHTSELQSRENLVCR